MADLDGTPAFFGVRKRPSRTSPGWIVLEPYPGAWDDPDSPTWWPEEGPGSGDDRYRFRPGTEAAAIPSGPERPDSFHQHPHYVGSTIVFLDSWGDAIRWPCGHERIVVGEHRLLDRPHRCPTCEPPDTCGIKYMPERPDLRPEVKL